LDKVDFLIEIGVEELPADQIKPAMDFIENSFRRLCVDSRISFTGLQPASTPRRLAMVVLDLDAGQEDIILNKVGPSTRICYDDAGNLSPAALGFLRKNSATPDDIYIEKTEKGEFIAINIQQKGKPTADILQDWIVNLLPAIPFGKTMIWEKPECSFSRPIRWMVSILGTEVLPVEVWGISGGNRTRGLRILGLENSLEIASPRKYFKTLKSAQVVADRAERLASIRAELLAITEQNSFRVIIDERLLETVTDMVENPSAVIAEFEPQYLKLPSQVITSTISQNQKYFSIVDKNSGELLNKFVFISNGDPQYADVIRIGNEKVVKPRLADAMWYFEEDTKKPLESFVPTLTEVVFHSKLGTVADKSRRITKLGEEICHKLGLDSETTAHVSRAALLCKADLVTLMLGEKEFTKLQGYIGREYALHCQEAPEVADAIYEHYMPKGQNDDLPSTLCGSILAVADKLDTVCGIIGIGLIPTGSGDPYALRRAANGVVQIIAAQQWKLDLSSLIDVAIASYQDKIETGTRETVYAFFKQRTQWLLKQIGLDYDIVDSVMHIDISMLTNLIRRAKALQELRSLPQFINLVISFKRVSNIIADAKEIPSINEDLLVTDEERDLYSALMIQSGAIASELDRTDYAAVIRCLIELGPQIDLFFDKVLVNCEDKALKQNRYALLSLIRREFLHVADLSLIVVESA
jgi:glycyl-tRNA synthetase beta chain